MLPPIEAPAGTNNEASHEIASFPNWGLWLIGGVAFGAACALVLYLLCIARSHRRPDWKELNSAQLAVFGAVSGVLAGALAAIFSKHDVLMDLIVALMTAVFCVQIGEIMRSHRIGKRLASLERALDIESAMGRLDQQLNSLELLETVKEKFKCATPLFEEFTNKAFLSIHDTLSELAEGTIAVNDTCRELTFNSDCLRHLAAKVVWAISFEDGTFWDDPEGKDFLKLHKEKIRDGVKIYRIFVLKEEELAQQAEIIREQNDMGIECWILLQSQNRNVDIVPEDFVLYDERFVRTGRKVSQGPTTSLKHAVLSCQERYVRDYQQKRNDFKTRSEPALEVLARFQSK